MLKVNSLSFSDTHRSNTNIINYFIDMDECNKRYKNGVVYKGLLCRLSQIGNNYPIIFFNEQSYNIHKLFINDKGDIYKEYLNGFLKHFDHIKYKDNKLQDINGHIIELDNPKFIRYYHSGMFEDSLKNRKLIEARIDKFKCIIDPCDVDSDVICLYNKLI